jgi:hypothetical protein
MYRFLKLPLKRFWMNGETMATKRDRCSSILYFLWPQNNGSSCIFDGYAVEVMAYTFRIDDFWIQLLQQPYQCFASISNVNFPVDILYMLFECFQRNENTPTALLVRFPFNQ